MLLFAHNLRKDSLAQQLGNAASAESCLSIIAEYLSEFASPGGEVVKSFNNPKQAIVACDILNIYISQIGRLSNLFKTRPVQIRTKPVASPENETTDEANIADGTILGIGSAAVIGGLMTNPVLGVPLALAGGLLACQSYFRGKTFRCDISMRLLVQSKTCSTRMMCQGNRLTQIVMSCCRHCSFRADLFCVVGHHTLEERLE